MESRRLTTNQTTAILSTPTGRREVRGHGGRSTGGIEGLRAGPNRDPQTDPRGPGHRVWRSPAVASARGGDPGDPRASESRSSPAGDPEGHRLHLRSVSPRAATGARGRAKEGDTGTKDDLDTSAVMRFLQQNARADD